MADLLLLLARVRHVLSGGGGVVVFFEPHAAAVVMGHGFGFVTLLWLYQFLQGYDSRQDQSDFAEQQSLTGDQSNHFKRHRSHYGSCHHTGHHHSLLHGLFLLFATTWDTHAQAQSKRISPVKLLIHICVVYNMIRS